MTSPGGIVALDFDGVICDSTDECLVVSWNAWMAFQGRPERRFRAAEMDAEERRRFRVCRPFCRRIEDYLDFFGSAEPGISDPEGRLRYRSLFLRERSLLREENTATWIRMHSFHSDVVRVARSLRSESRLYIVTFKDRHSVEILLRSRSLELAPDRLITETEMRSKSEALGRISVSAAKPRSEILLVDDGLAHLESCHQQGFMCALADWGYLEADDRGRAVAQGIPVLTLPEMSRLTAAITPPAKEAD